MNNVESERFITPGFGGIAPTGNTGPLGSIPMIISRPPPLPAPPLVERRIVAFGLKETKEFDAHDGHEEYYLPGSFGVVGVFFSGIPRTVKLISQAIFYRDLPSLSELGIITVQIGLYTLYALTTLARYFLSAIAFLSTLNIFHSAFTVLATFATTTSVSFSVAGSLSLIGSLLCGLELIIQSRWIYRTTAMIRKYSYKEESVMDDLLKIKREYFTLTEKELEKIEKKANGDEKISEKLINRAMNEKLRQLTKMLRPWLAQKIHDNIDDLIEEVNCGETTRAMEVMKEIKAQCQKRFLLGAISLTAVLLSFTGVVLLPFTTPAVVAVAMVIAVMVTSVWLFKTALFYGLMDSSGWKFEPNNLVPNKLKKLLS